MSNQFVTCNNNLSYSLKKIPKDDSEELTPIISCSDKVTTVGRVLNTNGTLCFDFCNTGICFKTITDAQLKFTIRGETRLIIRIGNDSNEIHIPNSCCLFINMSKNNDVFITKVIEPIFGVVYCNGLMHGNIQPLQLLKKQCIEFIGDSLTCGFGNIGDVFHNDQNSELTWAFEIANYMNCYAQYHCWSGVGLVQNGDTSTNNLIGSIRKRWLGTNPNCLYDFSLCKVDYVFINIGTNDFGRGSNDELNKKFKDALIDLIHELYQSYGTNLIVFLVCGPVIYDFGKVIIRECKDLLSDTYKNLYCVDCTIDLKDPSNIGYAKHPSAKGHKKMAENIIPQVCRILNEINR
ncbi:Endoglucanase [Entamoeba marina]